MDRYQRRPLRVHDALWQRPGRGHPSDRRRVIRGRLRSRVALCAIACDARQRALERYLARFDTGAPGGCAFLASLRGGHWRRLAWCWSRRPGWVRCVSRRRCGPSGPKAVGGARRAAGVPRSPARPRVCGPAAPRPAGAFGARRYPQVADDWARRAQRALEDVRKVLTSRGAEAVSCPGRCLSLQSHQMAYRCAVSRLSCRMFACGRHGGEAGIGTGRVVGGRAAVPGGPGCRSRGSGDGGR